MKKRNGEIDLLKFMFSVSIILFHSKNFAEADSFILFKSAMAVSFFFIVSGYFLVKSVEKISLSETEAVGPVVVRFIGKKIKGFLPNYYVAWIIGFCVECYVKWNGSITKVISNGLYGFFELTFLSQAGFLKSTFRANTVTWYISAMLIVMAIYVPLLIKKRKTFLTLIAPLISILIYGYVYSNYRGGFGPPSMYLNFMTKGLLRAFAEIALGCTCFVLAQKLKGLAATIKLKILLTAISLGGYIFVFGGSMINCDSHFKMLMTVAIAISVTITLSEQTVYQNLFNNKVCLRLGSLSFDLYLSHGFWSHAMDKMLPNMGYERQLVLYLILTLCTALLIRQVSGFILKIWPSFVKHFKSIMLKAA